MLTQTQKLLLFSQFLVSGTQAGKCPFGFGGSDDDKAKPDDHALPQLDDLVISSDNGNEVRKLQAEPEFLYPSQLFQCSETDGRPKALRTSDDFTTLEYEAVAESINELYEDAEDKAAFAGCLVRLAGHDLMDFRYEFKVGKDGKMSKSAIKQKGGVDGCINFADKDNRGLVECIQDAGILEAYDEHCGVVSLADFIVIAAEATMARTSKSFELNFPLDPYSDGTLAKTFRDQFQYGRVTEEECEWNTGMMPDPENGLNDVTGIFFDHIFKFKKGADKKRLTAAILGAHTLGSAKAENSGYEGSWSGEGSEGVFDNDYYRQMLTRGWGPDRSVNGNDERNQWKTVDSGPAGGLMLNSDLALAYDNNAVHQQCMKENNNNNRRCKKLQNKGEPINALTSQCCAWTHKGALFNKGVLDKKAGTGALCGAQIPAKGKGSQFDAVREACCSAEHTDSTGDCDSSQWPKGKMFPNVLAFAANEDQWLESFAQAWRIATENGHIDLQQLVSETDEDEEYECGKLKTRKLCETEAEKCLWQKKTTPDNRGRFRHHCDLATTETALKMIAEKEAKLAEKARKKAEKEMKKAENQRKKAERDAERERKRAEKEKKKAEMAKKKAEQVQRRNNKMNKNKTKKQNGGSLMEDEPLKP